MGTDIMERYDLTLHQMRLSRSLRVTWLAAELGILENIKLLSVALMEGEQNQSTFRDMNKMSAVPVLTLTDKETTQETVMTESAAICTFLTDLVPAGMNLKPSADNIPALAVYHRFITFAVASFDPWLWQIRLNEELLPKEAASPSAAQYARKEIAKKVIPCLEDALEGRDFICEPHHTGFTTADIILGFTCFWAQKYELFGESPIIQDYVQRVTTRDQFKEALWLKAAL